MATDWSEEAKARRSASARKAAETRKRNRENPMRASMPKGVPEKKHIQNSRVARWALSGVAVGAMIRGAQHIACADPATIFLTRQYNFT